MRSNLAPLILFMLLNLLGSNCFAESSDSVSLEEVRRHAVVHSLEIKEIDASFARRAAESFSVGRLQNPQLQGSTGIPVDSEDGRPETQFGVSLTQPLRASDFGSRGRLGDLISSVSSNEKQAELQEFFGGISKAFNRAWSLQVEVGHLKKQLSRAKNVLSLLSKPGSEGRFSPPQLDTARAEVARLEAELLGVAHSRSKVQARLMRATGFSFGDKQLLKPKLVELPPFEGAWSDLQENQYSLLKRYELLERVAAQRLKVAEKDRFPEFQPQLGYSRNEEGDDFIGIGFSIDLPFFQRNEANISKARSSHSSSRAKLSYFRSGRFKEEFRLIYDGATSKREQAKVYEKRVLPSLRKALKGSEKLFQTGQLSLLELWKSQSDFHDALDLSLQLWVEAFNSNIEVTYLTGTMQY